MLRDLKINNILFFFIVFCSCDMSYPDVKEVDYVINYYFTKDKLDYFMTFDFAVRVLNSKDISKFVIENINSKEFIEMTKDKYVSYFIDSVLGKDILYCKDLRFNVADKTFESFEAKVLLFDFGMRVYSKDIVINLSLSEEELALMHDYVYKFKDMVKLNKISDNNVYLIRTPKDEIDFLYSVAKIEDLINTQMSDGNLDTYLGFYYIGKNSNLFFKLN
ncbi:hypothetical protein CNO14_03210 [Borrelia miyamotoi]|uniref:Lipoprotein n=1 Tax=Borrelia miyamotoi TaxID=47466 RepID=A0AAP8YWN3_9SPIR|nr:hypothetical protein [Borrelia miyamotoi]AHH05204.1 Hypothetical protein BOM_0661 [Borrelia miyamotoi FR64b]ATQ14985.1 hypothetical protein CNO14_03210 [Borrelia miyamotoi]ATQ16168.1 hypothetical protein CNO13_03210 [Borrelia miyamotoi]ATQ17313.1 hypothetical protein CNO12_03215 [Borrelia miyamotoi]ATQ18181.1 hypothetical protein CNO11_01035 [Borrelia miyamotoi]